MVPFDLMLLSDLSDSTSYKRMFLAVLLFSALRVSAGTPHGQIVHIEDGDLDGLVITMKRDECFGPCPVYSVSIHGDGTVVYEGSKYVKVEGKRDYKIPKTRVKELVREFYRIGFFSLKDSYTSLDKGNGLVEEVTDLPGTTTTITIGGRTKSVYNYYGGPKALERLEDKIDKISGSAKYVRRRT